jgi:hypothetical protein
LFIIEKRMPQKTNVETIEKIRERMKSGANASQVAQELELSKTTVYTYSKDVPRKHTCTTIEQRDEICDLVRQGRLSKSEVAALYNRSLRTIRTITKNIPGYTGYRSNLGDGEKRLLIQLLKEGCLVSDFYISTARNLKMQFPMFIRTVRISNKTIFYLVGREKEVVNGYLKTTSVRLVDHSFLKKLCKLLDMELSTSEENDFLQRRFLGPFNEVPSTSQKKLEDFGSEPVFIYDIEDQG